MHKVTKIRKVLPPVPGMMTRPLTKVENLDPKEVGQAYDRMEAEATLSREIDGLAFASTMKVVEYIDTFPDNAPPEMHARLLQLAANRLRRVKTDEPSYLIATMSQTSLKHPMQYDGTLEDGESFFIRYRKHNLTVHVDDHLVEYQELPGTVNPNVLEFGQLKMLLRDLFMFPDEDSVILKRI